MLRCILCSQELQKTPPFGLKKKVLTAQPNFQLSIFNFQFLTRSFFSDSGVFASNDVFNCVAIRGDVVAGAGACSQIQSHDIGTAARRAKTSEEGFLRFL